MKHRHLNHDDLTFAAIDSIIERGAWRDWLRLAREIRKDAAIAQKVDYVIKVRRNNKRDEELDRDLFGRWREFPTAGLRRHNKAPEPTR